MPTWVSGEVPLWKPAPREPESFDGEGEAGGGPREVQLAEDLVGGGERRLVGVEAGMELEPLERGMRAPMEKFRTER